MKISRIPESIQDDDLEDCVTKIFNEYDTPVDPANIEAFHRLKSKARPKKVIIKDAFNILQRKKKLKSVDITKVGLPQGSLVFINQSLCSYYNYLWSLCKRLHSKKLIHSFWVSTGNVNLKVRENTPMLLVSHVSDLEKHFDIKGLVGDAEDYFFSYLVMFVIFVRCVSSQLFYFLLRYCRHWEVSFERCSEKSALEIYKPS